MDPRLPALHAWLAQRAVDPVDEREAASVVAFRAALARLEHPFDQDADPTHVTASAIVVGPVGVVLLRHKRLGIWVQPGGHVEAGEELSVAARREAIEETGLDLEHPADGARVVHIDVHPGGRGHTHLDVRWLLQASTADAPRPPEGESQEVAWFDWPSAVERADPGLAGALVRLQPGRT